LAAWTNLSQYLADAMDHAEKAGREFVLASGDRTVDFPQAEHALDAVALPCRGYGRARF
jgi:hypothetical protein